jgi:hypothetical protein
MMLPAAPLLHCARSVLNRLIRSTPAANGREMVSALAERFDDIAAVVKANRDGDKWLQGQLDKSMLKHWGVEAVRNHRHMARLAETGRSLMLLAALLKMECGDTAKIVGSEGSPDGGGASLPGKAGDKVNKNVVAAIKAAYPEHEGDTASAVVKTLASVSAVARPPGPVADAQTQHARFCADHAAYRGARRAGVRRVTDKGAAGAR